MSIQRQNGAWHCTSLRVFSLVALAAILIRLLPIANASEIEEQVAEVERQFAATMARRDFEGFKAFLSTEAVFLAGTRQARGKAAIAERWQQYFDEVDAPFSWEPETVSVLDSGTLALSTGPVWNSSGKRTSTYTSIWQLNDSGEWKIIFDKGNAYCD